MQAFRSCGLLYWARQYRSAKRYSASETANALTGARRCKPAEYNTVAAAAVATAINMTLRSSGRMGLPFQWLRLESSFESIDEIEALCVTDFTHRLRGTQVGLREMRVFLSPRFRALRQD